LRKSTTSGRRRDGLGFVRAAWLPTFRANFFFIWASAALSFSCFAFAAAMSVMGLGAAALA